VAVKVLSQDLAPLLGAERFAREIRITSRLQHPNILAVLDSGQADGHPYYVMPFVDGESLAQRLRRESQLPIDQALDLTAQIADALVTAHEQGFVHRDIKPGNILLTGGRALLADFGIARAMDLLTDEKLTESGVALGTATYMSPEQASGARVDGRSDIYSLGCVLFEMLAGGPPFSGGSSQSVRARHVVDPVPRIHTVRATVTPSLERIVDKAMAKVPADRYADARQFRDALRGVNLTETTAILPRRRRNRLIPIAGSVGALAIAAMGWRLIADRSPKPDPHRVMVFPLVAPADFKGPRTIGEDVATMIGGALDGAGPLRWIDAWPLLDPGQRNDIRALTQSEARALARKQRCAYFVTGRIIAQGDSAEVSLVLNDVAGDSTAARGSGVGSADRAWRVGLLAVNKLLPVLIPGGSPDVAAEWQDRDPGAVASFLLGEAAFRRIHLGEALNRYRDAVRADSSFGLAAIRGAQAATWNHRSSEAAAFIRVALRQKLTPRYLHFALGYAAYLQGRADSAAAELRRAIEVDPDMAVAWVQLGEVYTHLLPEAGRVDSLSQDAFETAHRLDPRATNLLLHLIEQRLRRGDTAGAAPLVSQFLFTTPDTAKLSAQVRIVDRCVRNGPESVSWATEATRQPYAVLGGAQALAAGGAQPTCAEAGFSSLVQADTSRAGDVRWYALLGLQSLLLAQGRAADAMNAVGAAPADDQAPRMFLLDAPVYPDVASNASAVAQGHLRQCGPAFTGCSNSYLVWQLAVWSALGGDASQADVGARQLESRAAAERDTSAAIAAGILARSAKAQAVLAAGDTAAAFTLLDALLREPLTPGAPIEWNIALPRALDRLAFVRLLIGRREYRRAIAVADVFDSPAPAIYVLYVPESLRLRAQAASAIGDASLHDRYLARLARLEGNSSVAGLPPQPHAREVAHDPA
jgi:tetratricopeptide (TPR) repeat protein